MTPHYQDDSVTLHHGDCLDVLRELPDNSVDAVVTDPPYGLEFMGKEWDKFDGGKLWDRKRAGAQEGRINGKGGMDTFGDRPNFKAGAPFQAWCELWTAECLRVLKPGGHLLAFGGTRTWHRLACAVEDAGFEVRDSIAWLYGSGFPKSLDVSKAIDKAAGAEREVVGSKLGMPGYSLTNGNGDHRTYSRGLGNTGSGEAECAVTAPATDNARKWAGFGTALKPAFEPIVVARKPLNGTVAQSVLTWGTGALNIDGCRINPGADVPGGGGFKGGATSRHEGWTRPSHAGGTAIEPHTAGRWPANVVLDESQAAALDEMSGVLTSGARNGPSERKDVSGWRRVPNDGVFEASVGGASRFFYVAKAPKRERPVIEHADGTRTAHPTVKPIALMRWLVRLVTPPGGTILEPFAGSGTTIEAALLEGFNVIGIEREAEYLPLIEQRIARCAATEPDVDPDLFDLLDGGAA